jgi:3-hydroxyethyl bacteriochlorophyllide a dehydrogenase
MNAVAVVLQQPEDLALQDVALCEPGAGDVVVDITASGISTGTERLLYSGRMPAFPGMGYPLIPGYESVGVVSHAGPDCGRRAGERVFVPGANCFGSIRGLFGGAASRLVVPASRALPIGDMSDEQGILLALAATAAHAVAGELPQLIVGHGVLGRLAARIVVAQGGTPPVVWERNEARMDGASGYTVLHPQDDPRRDYTAICDMSGDPAVIDQLVARLAPGGEIVLAGFYADPLSFAFPPAFMREARLRVAAQWQPRDLHAAMNLIADQRLSLEGLVTHRLPARHAQGAYRTAFSDASCLKMILDWRDCA